MLANLGIPDEGLLVTAAEMASMISPVRYVFDEKADLHADMTVNPFEDLLC